jgi:CubicO group peptidase (beta-lactamase class C family)
MIATIVWGMLLAGQPLEPRISLKQLNTILNDAKSKHKVPGMAGAVVTSRGVHAMTWVGVRKAGTISPIGEKDLWHLGSDTKAFTATLLAVLHEKEKIDYDTPLPKLFPKLASAMKPEYKEVTLSDALRHRTGLASNLKDWWSVPTTARVQVQRLQALRRGLSMEPTEPPGKKFHYSNMGYVLAGAAAEQAMNEEWETLIERHVLRPLEIRSAGFGAPGTVGKLDQPLGHNSKGQPVEPSARADNPPVMGPAARLHLSLGDWTLFIQDHLAGAQGKGKLLQPQTYKKLHTPLEGETYTLGGWIYESSGGIPVLTHDGSNGGFYCSAVLLPTLDIGVLVVCNQGPKAGEAAVKEAILTAVKATVGR